MSAPRSLIINSAFTEPTRHWIERADRTLAVEEGRRRAGYEIIDTRENTRRIPSIFHQDPLRRRILLSLKLDAVVQHLLQHVHEQNLDHLEPVFDAERPIGSTRDMRTWYTTRPCRPTRRSQVSHLVVDSAWESYAAELLESHPGVLAWVKNDHLGFHVYYLWNGSKRRYVPDFLIGLSSGRTLVLEIKGQDTAQDRAKRAALDEWVHAVNAHGGLGHWCSDVVIGEPAMTRDVIDRCCVDIP